MSLVLAIARSTTLTTDEWRIFLNFASILLWALRLVDIELPWETNQADEF